MQSDRQANKEEDNDFPLGLLQICLQRLRSMRSADVASALRKAAVTASYSTPKQQSVWCANSAHAPHLTRSVAFPSHAREMKSTYYCGIPHCGENLEDMAPLTCDICICMAWSGSSTFLQHKKDAKISREGNVWRILVPTREHAAKHKRLKMMDNVGERKRMFMI